jgi:hypothetical protein
MSHAHTHARAVVAMLVLAIMLLGSGARGGFLVTMNHFHLGHEDNEVES